MVTSARHPNCLVLPGGGIDPGETPAIAAEREAREEAGIVARCTLVPLCEVRSDSKRTHTHVFLLESCELLDSFDDAALRSRHWVPLAQVEAAAGNRPHQLETMRTVLHALRGWAGLPATEPPPASSCGVA